MGQINLPVYVRRAMQIGALHIQYQHRFQESPNTWCLDVRPEPWRIDVEKPTKCNWHGKYWTITCVHLFYDRNWEVTLYLKQGSDQNHIRDWKALSLMTTFPEHGEARRVQYHEGRSLYHLLVTTYGMDIYDLEHKHSSSEPSIMKNPGQQSVKYAFPNGDTHIVTLCYELIDGHLRRRVDPPAHMDHIMQPWYI